MNTYKELVYIVLDELKGLSDDFTYTEEHIMFLLDKYRAFILKQKYYDIKKQIPESNYQTLCLDLIQVPAISGEPCEGGYYLRSSDKIPHLIPIGNIRVSSLDYFQGDFTYVSRDRMKYVGHNKYLKNIIYCSLGPDNYLYFKSSNPQYLYLEKVNITGIFEDTISVNGILSKDSNSTCDSIDNIFPLEDALVPVVIELIVKELSTSIYRPEDNNNNAKDDLGEVNIKN